MCRDPHYPTTNHGSKQDMFQGDHANLIPLTDQAREIRQHAW